MKRVLELPLAAGEEGELARCFDSLKVEKGRMAVLSQALFQYRLADWLARAGGQDGRIGGDELVLLLSQGVREGLSVRQLAQRACVCERTFRMLVRKYTGKAQRNTCFTTRWTPPLRCFAPRASPWARWRKTRALATRFILAGRLRTGLEFSPPRQGDCRKDYLYRLGEIPVICLKTLEK